MRAAGVAAHFGPEPTETVVRKQFHGIGRERFVEARPSTSGIEFRFGLEKRRAARGALVYSRLLIVQKFPGERRFGAGLAENAVLFRRKFALPLGVGFCRAGWHC